VIRFAGADMSPSEGEEAEGDKGPCRGLGDWMDLEIGEADGRAAQSRVDDLGGANLRALNL